MSPQRDAERAPLLQNASHDSSSSNYEELVQFDKNGDDDNPREWPQSRKYIQVLQIFILAFVCPMASSVFAPAADAMAEDLGSSQKLVLGGQAGFVCMLGIGPLFLAPMSETFGRRNLFVWNLAIFTLFQIPTALAPNAPTFIVMRTLSGFFGSVGVANGGGSIQDMFETHERAPVLGIYLIAPLLAPSFGSFIGAVMIANVNWRWIFWFVMILSGVVTTMCYFFLYETNAVTILLYRKQRLQDKHPDMEYKVDGASDQSIPKKIAQVCLLHDRARSKN